MITVNKKDQDEFNKKDTDPLLALIANIGMRCHRNKETLKNSVCPKIRVVKGAHADHPDPLIALLGTLESDVTDIGETA